MISRCRVVTLDEQRKNPGCLGHYRGLYYPVIQQPVRVCISWLRAALLRGSELPELPADRIGLDWKNARKSQGDDVFGIVGIFSHGFCFGPKFRRMVWDFYHPAEGFWDLMLGRNLRKIILQESTSAPADDDSHHYDYDS